MWVGLLAGYADDGREVTSILKEGMTFDKNKNKFMFCKEEELKDIELRMKGETVNQRMARVTRTAMNSVNKDLVFTTECQEDLKMKGYQL